MGGVTGKEPHPVRVTNVILKLVAADWPLSIPERYICAHLSSTRHTLSLLLQAQFMFPLHRRGPAAQSVCVYVSILTPHAIGSQNEN